MSFIMKRHSAPWKAAIFRVLRIACLSWSLTTCGNAAASLASKDSQTGFTAYGESCAGAGCIFDESSVGADIHEFCLVPGVGGGRAVQLVRPTDDHLGLELVEEGMQLLRSIPKPIAIVTAIGSVKTGKSSLLNVLNEHVLCAKGDQLDGFHVSDSVNATTRGIWIWSEPIEVESRVLQEHIDKGLTSKSSAFDHLVTVMDSLMGGTLRAKLTAKGRADFSKRSVDRVNVVLLDVEGFNSTDGFQRYDEALFTLAATLSTELIYLTHKVLDSRDLLDLQHMLQTANSTIVNIYRSLSNAPSVVIGEGNYARSHQGVSVIQQAGVAEETGCDACNIITNVSRTASGERLGGGLLDLQTRTTLTMSVQGFNLQLQESALDYLNEVINVKRFDLSYNDQRSFLANLSQMREQFVRFFKADSRSRATASSPDQLATDLISRMTSGYKYVIPHVFGAVDALLMSAPSKNNKTPRKCELARGYLEQVLNFKIRLFKRCLMSPKTRVSFVLNDTVHMAGNDFGDLLDHLVKTLNDSLKAGSVDYEGDFRLTRANLVKNDLVDLYAQELGGFTRKLPIPLPVELADFNEVTKTKYIQLIELYASYDITPDNYRALKADFEGRLSKLMEYFDHELHEITLKHCRAVLPGVKNAISELTAQLKLPVLPSVIEDLERKRLEILDIFVQAVDANGVEYSTTEASKAVAVEVVEFIDTQIHDLYRENESEINAVFQEGTRRAIEFYVSNSDRNAVEKYRVSSTDFVESVNAWIGGSYAAYYQVVGDFKEMDDMNRKSLEFLGKQLSLLEKESMDHWDDVCRHSLSQTMHRFKSTFDVQLQQLVPFRPAPKPILRIAIEYLRARGWAAMAELHCGTSQVVRNTQPIFNRMVDEIGQNAVKSNDESVFRHFHKEFMIMYQEAVERVDHVYHFYQLKKHMHWYAKRHVFAHIKVVDQLLRPKRAAEELKKNVDVDVLENITDAKLLREAKSLLLIGSADASKTHVIDASILLEDIVEQWLSERLYPRIRNDLMIRMPKLSTFFAMAAVLVCSTLMFNVRNARLIYFLCCIDVIAFVHMMGLRRVMLLLGMAARWAKNLLTMAIATLGVSWSVAIAMTLLAGSLLWRQVVRRMPAILGGRRRSRYLLLKQGR
ncbi:hypothetical protein, conserved [Babesia bigemina]|uniref:Guanylate-binding protein N-terminal domain-containing protein n=1 Tax=Babesia bigemina TaxID=5866 RepID=A0A061D0F7_BABBI|nr:hypothetical protein, conserved [Babesia bigemina]CDR94158.1 hypothetical protein, conserved [Babesia bigemina]|eukprot:XP_012766344.1 hypothetical protein, conserved [Babesia bigemina]